MPSDFSTFFHTATGHLPYGYQCRLACGEGIRLDDDSTLGLREQLPLPAVEGDYEFHQRSAINYQPTLASSANVNDPQDSNSVLG